MTKFFVYILKCADGSYYVGMTTNLHQRLQHHRQGRGPLYTKHRLPVVLVYSEEQPDLASARKREIEIKDWRREKKERLIRQGSS